MNESNSEDSSAILSYPILVSLDLYHIDLATEAFLYHIYPLHCRPHMEFCQLDWCSDDGNLISTLIISWHELSAAGSEFASRLVCCPFLGWSGQLAVWRSCWRCKPFGSRTATRSEWTFFFVSDSPYRCKSTSVLVWSCSTPLMELLLARNPLIELNRKIRSEPWRILHYRYQFQN
jgi:hypothetical protein